MGILYRVRQFVRAINGPSAPPDLGALADLLAPEQRSLFGGMSLGDQHHCLAVARALLAAGHTDRDLLRSALVHDAGKSAAHIAPWERVAHVLLLRFAHSVVGRVGAPQTSGFGHGLYVMARHAVYSAAMAERAGFPPATVTLLRGDGPPEWQDALRRADDTN